MMITLKKMLAKLQMRTKTITEFKLKSDHGFLIAIFSGIGLEYLWLQQKRNEAREATFGKNAAVLYKEYNATHKEKMESDMGLKGYPDSGSNRYSDLLSYKDWLKIAGAELAHNKFIQELTFLFPCLVATYARNKKLTLFYVLFYSIYGCVQKRQLIQDPTSGSVQSINDLLNTFTTYVFLHAVLNCFLIMFKARYPLIWGRGLFKKIFRRKKAITTKPQ